MEHSDLVQDMTLLEKLSAQERLKQAKRRRQQQITNWLQREETSTDDQTASNVAISHETKRRETANPAMLSSKAHVRFPANIVLLEGKVALSSLSGRMIHSFPKLHKYLEKKAVS